MIKQGNASINILDYNVIVDGKGDVDNKEDDEINNHAAADKDNNKCESSQQQESPGMTKKWKPKWIAQKLNYTDHVKGHVITR